MSTVLMAHSSFGKTRQSISPEAAVYSTVIIFWLHLLLLLNHSLIYIYILFSFTPLRYSMKSIFLHKNTAWKFQKCSHNRLTLFTCLNWGQMKQRVDSMCLWELALILKRERESGEIWDHNTSNFTAKPGLDREKNKKNKTDSERKSEQGPFDNTKIGFTIWTSLYLHVVIFSYAALSQTE